MASDLVVQVQKIARARDLSKVLAVRLKVGPLAHISEEHFREHFALASRGTVAEGARLVMEAVSGAKGVESHGLVLDSLEVEG